MQVPAIATTQNNRNGTTHTTARAPATYDIVPQVSGLSTHPHEQVRHPKEPSADVGGLCACRCTLLNRDCQSFRAFEQEVNHAGALPKAPRGASAERLTRRCHIHADIPLVYLLSVCCVQFEQEVSFGGDSIFFRDSAAAQ